MKRIKTRALTASAAGAAMLLTGCAGGAPAPESAPGAPTSISIPVFPIADFAPVWVAIEQGYFEENLLDVALEPAPPTSAQSAALIASGEFQFGVSSVINVAQGQSQGIELVVVAGSTDTDGPDDQYLGTIVREDGPENLAELARSGNVIGVNGVGNVTDILTRNAMAESGGDVDAPDYQNVPYPQGAELVLNGSVTSSTLIEPFLTTALQAGGVRAIGFPGASVTEGSPNLSFVTSRDYAETNAQTVEAFRTSIASAIEWINDPANEEALLETLVENTGVPESALAAGALPSYSMDMVAAVVEEYLQIFETYGGLDAMPESVSDLFADGALG
ncbi:ABC transporter substrate-binding protein [Microbacterium suaedae]|uniref:ABC transporter substrate-binding protein n=1 Tax=Microbacterium suaedae TaxID=2067813 RepID=UPI000DA11354|nr:ABC transporter substrate-binding protein [Microbacterium suaedae]